MQKRKHTYKVGKRISWRVVVISLAILACVLMANYGNSKVEQDTPSAQSYFLKPSVVSDVKVVTKTNSTPHEPTTEEMVALIKKYFPKHSKEMVAIAIAESRLSYNRVGYNCFYRGYRYTDKVTGRVRTVITDDTPLKQQTEGVLSTSCLSGDEVYSWSIDCFVLQKNYPGKLECPRNVTPEQHIKESALLSEECGLDCWSSVYLNPDYKNYLKQAEVYLAQI